MTNSVIEKRRAADRARYKKNRKSKLAKQKQYDENNREAIREKAKARYHRTDQAELLLQSARSRATRKNIPFELTVDDIQVPTHCPVLGIELKRNSKGSGPKHNSPTLDRINPADGYVPGNVHVISSKANRIKTDATPEEIMQVANYFLLLASQNTPRPTTKKRPTKESDG